MGQPDADNRPEAIAPIRMIWTLAGWLAFGMGLAGVILPLVPTVPFMLLAAYCFARGSRRVHHWLTTHPRFGPAIQDWQRHRAISRKGKLAATIGIACAFGMSLLIGVAWHVLAIQAVVLSAVMVFIWSRPDGPKPAP